MTHESSLLPWVTLAIIWAPVILVLKFVNTEAKVSTTASGLEDIQTLTPVGVRIVFMESAFAETLYLVLQPQIILTICPYTCELLKQPVTTAF